MKYLQVRLEEGLWKRIALRALDDGVRMSELVREVLLKEFGGPAWSAKTEHGQVKEQVVAPVESDKVDKPKGHPLLSNIPIG